METPWEDTGYQPRRRPKRGGAALAGAPGAPPSNRAPDSCMPSQFQALSLHVDSLELSYRGTLREGVVGRLNALRELARSPSPKEQAKAQLVVRDETLLVRDKGVPLFPYVLENGAFFLKLANRAPSSPLPCVYCQFRSEYLVQVGPINAEAELRVLLRNLLLLDGDETVSRIDLALDFTTDAVMDSWSRRAWVTKIRGKSSYSDGELFTGWRIGSHRNQISLRLYDKTHEISHVSGKTYLYEIWNKAGHLPWNTVWRIEGQFRREALRSFDLDTLPRTVEAFGGLWRHLTNDAVKLCVENPDDATRGRWAESLLWQAIASVDWHSPVRELRREVRPTGAPSNEYFARQFKSLVTSKMARDGEDGAESAAQSLLAILEDALYGDGELTGACPETALRDIAANKARKFFTRRNVPGGTPALPPPDEAAVRAYRDASRGG
jgi:hypothetical protein